MTLKKLKTIDVFVIFALCFFTHSLYNLFSNGLFSIFFPVNESIWEHMKMIFSALMISGIIDYFLINVNLIYFLERDKHLPYNA